MRIWAAFFAANFCRAVLSTLLLPSAQSQMALMTIQSTLCSWQEQRHDLMQAVKSAAKAFLARQCAGPEREPRQRRRRAFQQTIFSACQVTPKWSAHGRGEDRARSFSGIRPG